MVPEASINYKTCLNKEINELLNLFTSQYFYSQGISIVMETAFKKNN